MTTYKCIGYFQSEQWQDFHKCKTSGRGTGSMKLVDVWNYKMNKFTLGHNQITFPITSRNFHSLPGDEYSTGDPQKNMKWIQR